MVSLPPVLPAYAGMIQAPSRGRGPMVSAPRVCGDDPTVGVDERLQLGCSPRMRG